MHYRNILSYMFIVHGHLLCIFFYLNGFMKLGQNKFEQFLLL